MRLSLAPHNGSMRRLSRCCTPPPLRRAPQLYKVSAVLHLINAAQYASSWLPLGYTWCSPVMIPEYLNMVEAAMYAWTAWKYEDTWWESYDGPITVQVHKVCAWRSGGVPRVRASLLLHEQLRTHLSPVRVWPTRACGGAHLKESARGRPAWHARVAFTSGVYAVVVGVSGPSRVWLHTRAPPNSPPRPHPSPQRPD